MKTNFLRKGCCLVFLLFALSAISHAEGTVSVPHMTIHERTFDFKEVEEGAKVEHAFLILNKGDKALEIKRVKPS